MTEHYDVVVVGAGLSGIAQAYHLQRQCPDRSYVILEARDAIGGTWDLFRYPGIRSDSDMHTLGFAFRPWTGEKAIADGATIRDYIAATAAENGIDRRICYGVSVRSAAWSSAEARWTIEAEGPDGPLCFTAGFVSLCAGYYDYRQGHTPDFAGSESFEGRIVHPQFWPADLDVASKRVVVIGSGATAMTLVPALAATAAQVTMLQRSPTYVVSRPSRDALASRLARILPRRPAYALTRWKNIVLGMAFFQLARRRPSRVRERLIGMVRDQLGPGYDVATHFTPRYDPWDQRLCLVPDADLFTAIRSGRASVVTDTIDRFVADGVRLASGTLVKADVIVTATGLRMRLAGGIALSIDGTTVNPADRLLYKGMMFEGVPNIALFFGYTNASWTLKAELTARYVCRLLNTMKKRGVRQAMPVNEDPDVGAEPFLDFTSGYVQRAAGELPQQGTKAPWRLHQNYARDLLALRFGSLDKAMRFSDAGPWNGAITTP